MNREDRLAADGYEGVEPVLFYHPDDENGIFSNFSKHPVVLVNPWTDLAEEYDTSEHRYQAMKAISSDDHDYVAFSESAFESKMRGGRTGGIELRSDWGNDRNSFCYYVMLEVVTAKVFQHPEMLELLIETGNRPIYEDSPTDDIWGWRYREDYRGKNLLGRTLMEVRSLF